MNLIETTFNISRKYNHALILFKYPSRAWELLMTVATGKPRNISLKTSRSGAYAGLIIVGEDTILPPGYATREYKDGKKVLLYNKMLVTSDLDIFWIERKEGEKVFLDLEFGYVTDLEKRIISELNLIFREFSGREVNMITHGPYYNHNSPKKEDIIFPYDAFHPTLGYKELKNVQQLKDFNEQLDIVETWAP